MVPLPHHGARTAPFVDLWMKPVSLSISVLKARRLLLYQGKRLMLIFREGSNKLVGYVLGDKPFYLHLKTCGKAMETFMLS